MRGFRGGRCHAEHSTHNQDSWWNFVLYSNHESSPNRTTPPTGIGIYAAIALNYTIPNVFLLGSIMQQNPDAMRTWRMACFGVDAGRTVLLTLISKSSFVSEVDRIMIGSVAALTAFSALLDLLPFTSEYSQNKPSIENDDSTSVEDMSGLPKLFGNVSLTFDCGWGSDDSVSGWRLFPRMGLRFRL
jgi:hypothetical protein